METTRTNRFSKVAVLVIEPDARMAGLMRKMISSLGFGKIYIAGDGTEGLAIVGRTRIDFVITDWEMRPMDGLVFTEAVRRSGASPNPRLPVLMLTGRGKRFDVERARDSGITEFLVRPFTVRALCDRIALMIEHPRTFVVSETYSGPDRRRRGVPPDGKERRGVQPEPQPSQIDPPAASDEAVLIAADRRLRESLGPQPIGELFSDENVEKAQAVIAEAEDDYLNWVKEDLKWLEAALVAMEINPEHLPAAIERFREATARVKAQAGIFGYALASRVADQMSDLTFGFDHVPAARLVAARKHLDALYVIFTRRMTGDGGQTGIDLQASLAALTRFAG